MIMKDYLTYPNNQGIAIKPMKTVLSLSFLIMAGLISSVSAQGPGAPTYPGSMGSYGAMSPPAGSGLYGNTGYNAMAPSVPPPNYSTPSYSGPTMMEPAPQAANYGFQPQPQANAWGSIQQGMGASMLNYNYVEAGYRYVNPKGGNFDGSHGLGATLVFDLPMRFFVKGGFNWTSGSGGNTVAAAANADYALSTISIAGGVYMPITDKLHFVGEVGLIYANFDASTNNLSYTEAGVYIRPSLRYQMVEWLELQAGVTVSSTSDYDSKLIDIGAYFRVFPMVDLNLGADFGDETRTVRAGARLRW